MSKRRGIPSTNPALIERRRWYESIQEDLRMQNAPLEDSQASELLQKYQSTSYKRENVTEVEKTVDNFYSERLIQKLNNPTVANATVIFFHGIGQNPTYFKKWAKSLQSLNVNAFGICLPGRYNRSNEPFEKSITKVAKRISSALKQKNIVTARLLNLKSISSDGEREYSKGDRIICFGHSLGAIIAYEVVKNLLFDKFMVNHLVVSASLSPLNQSALNEDKTGFKFCFQPDKDLLERMVQLDAVPSAMLSRKEMLKQFIPLLRADSFMLEKYILIQYSNADKAESDTDDGDASVNDDQSYVTNVPKPMKISCPITAVVSLDDDTINGEEIAAWEKVTNSVFESQIFQTGGHNFLLVKQNETELLLLFEKVCGEE